MPKPKYLVVIVGPTAVGKTANAIQLAENFQTEIISGDSRQFYRDMPIGTAQPTKEEMRGVPHHFLSFLDVEESYTAGRFEKEALQTLRNLFIYQDIVILTGGSGLYIRALCEGLAEVPIRTPDVRTMLNTTLEQKGLPYLRELLAEKDPHYYNIVDLQNPKRVIRALEVYLSTGIPYSRLRQQPPKDKRTFHLIKIGLNQEKKILHEHINLRVDAMMEQGLLQEVEALYSHKTTNALQTIGYKELFDYIDGKYNLEKAVNQIKKNTKQYAKKQLTWFKKDKAITWFTPDDLSKINAHIRYIIDLFQNSFLGDKC